MPQLLDVAVGADSDGLVDGKLWQRETVGGAPATHHLQNNDRDRLVINTMAIKS